MQFYFIRHAQSTNNALWDATGQSGGRSDDPELTALGLEQSRLLAELLATGDPRGGKVPEGRTVGFGLTHLYCSLMVRSAATGWTLSQRLGLPLVALENIHEEGGIYLENAETGERNGLAGKDRAYFETHFPGIRLPVSFVDTGWWNYRPFETDEVRVQRARQFLDGLLAAHGGRPDKVAIVSHGGFFNLILAALLGVTPGENFWGLMYNTGITRFDFRNDAADLFYLNRVDHLPSDMLT